jgi:hypothetical protein
VVDPVVVDSVVVNSVVVDPVVAQPVVFVQTTPRMGAALWASTQQRTTRNGLRVWWAASSSPRGAGLRQGR